MIENYILKHKEIPVISFKLNTDSYEVEAINKIFEAERLPFGYRNGKETSYINQLNKWIDHRGISESRKDYEDTLYVTNAGSAKDLSVYSLGLNLTDHYWLHSEKHDYKWRDLNFFDNEFNDLVLKRIYPSDKDNDTSNIHPDFSVDGSLIKKWVYDVKDRILIKEGRSDNNQEPYNEAIASKIMKILSIDHVEYLLKTINNRKVSVCKCMVNSDTEFITASHIFDTQMNKNKNPYKQYIEICKKNGLADISGKLNEMIIMDFIMGNTDRHKRNFGIIRDANSLEWLYAAPLFDNGNSLFFDSTIRGSTKDNIDSYCKWFRESNYKKLEYIQYPEWYDFQKTKEVTDIIHAGLQKNKNISAEKIAKITRIAENRVKELDKVMRKLHA